MRISGRTCDFLYKEYYDRLAAIIRIGSHNSDLWTLSLHTYMSRYLLAISSVGPLIQTSVSYKTSVGSNPGHVYNSDFSELCVFVGTTEKIIMCSVVGTTGGKTHAA